MSEKVLTLFRGLPGAGKTTRIREFIRRNKGRPMVFSADDYFVHGRKYVFVPRDISKAHAQCTRNTINAMAVGTQHIIVDNTFTQKWEMGVYEALARALGYQFEVVDLFDGGCTDEHLAARNIHGVPIEKIKEMRGRYER